MSRTHAHAPYWVLKNRNPNPNEDFYIYHDHLKFGQPVYRQAPKRDAEGNFIYDTRRSYVTSDSVAFVEKYYGKQEIARRLNEGKWEVESFYDHTFRQFRTRYVSIWRYKVTERVIIGYHADFCTAQEWQDEDEKLENGLYAPCSPSVSWRSNMFPNSSSKREAQKTHRHGLRRKAKTRLRQEQKFYNSGEDLNDEIHNWESFHKMEGQSWWD